MRRRLREAVADNQWLLPIAGATAGLVLALALGTSVDEEVGRWTVTVDRSRDTLMSALALVFTALSIVLALASVAAQNVVSRFGPRMLRIYTRTSADRRVIAAFAMAATFIIVEQYQLRDLPPSAPAPVAGLTVSILMLVASGIAMIWYISAILRWFRVDQATLAVSEVVGRASRAVARHRRNTSADVALPARQDRSVDLLAPASGHLAEVDTDTLLQICRDSDTMVVVTSRLGQAVVRGEPIGWIAQRSPSDDTMSARPFSDAIDVSTTRELTLSIEYGVIALVDIAIMALSPAINDPNTAVEVVETMTFLFPEIADAPLGPYAVPDDESWPCVVASMRTFGELVELATTQVVLYGMSDPMVATALRRFAESLQRLELNERDRASVDAFAAGVSA